MCGMRQAVSRTDTSIQSFTENRHKYTEFYRGQTQVYRVLQRTDTSIQRTDTSIQGTDKYTEDRQVYRVLQSHVVGHIETFAVVGRHSQAGVLASS